MDKLWFLAEVDILRDLAPAELEQIAAHAPMQSVPAGAVFFSPERATEVLFILKRGRARLFRLSPGGKVFTTAILGCCSTPRPWRRWPGHRASRKQRARRTRCV